MQLQNQYTGPLSNFLGSLSLKGKQSRSRTDFVHQLANIAIANDKTRKEYAESFATKDADGKPEVHMNAAGLQSYNIPDDKEPEFNTKYDELRLAYHEFDVTANPQMFADIKDILLNTDVVIAPEYAEAYAHACSEFEKVV